MQEIPFHPLMLFYNKSFSTGIVPSSYKIQQIVPIFKKGLKTKASNYRPIALAPHTIKILERILRDILVEFFESNVILNCNQHGFRHMRSCASQLISYITYIEEQFIKKNEVDTLYVDFAKAFDKVDHQILIKKLAVYGVPKKIIIKNWQASICFTQWCKIL